MEHKGTMHLGEHVMVSDPSYDIGTWCQGKLTNVLSGEYDCFVRYSDEGRFGVRVAEIQAIHKGYVGTDLNEEMESFEVGVDGGSAGIFDYNYYENSHEDRQWQERCFDKTYVRTKNPEYEDFVWNIEGESIEDMMKRHDEYRNSTKRWPYLEKLDAGVIDNRGLVSSSGYGDGSYYCWTAKNNDDKIVSIRVEFISEENEE